MSRSLTRSVLYRKSYLEAFCTESYTSRAFSQNGPLPESQKKHEEPNLYSVVPTTESALENARPYKDMPSVPMIPFLGSSWAYIPLIGNFKKHRLHDADVIKNKLYGDIVRESFGEFEIVSSFNPETMKIISENEGTYPSRYTCLKAYRQKSKVGYKSDGFLVSQGSRWYEMRKALQKCMSRPIYLKDYLKEFREISQDFNRLIYLNRNKNEEVEDAMTFLRIWALECITSVALGARLGFLDTNLDDEWENELCWDHGIDPEGTYKDGINILKAVETQISCMYKLEASAGNFPLWKYIPTPTWIKFKKAADIFHSILEKYIDLTEFWCSGPDEGNPTFLQHVLFQKRGQRSVMDFPLAKLTVIDLIFSGVSKVPCTAGFLFVNLARNPEKQELAYQEVIGLLPNETDLLTPEVYDKLLYLKCCLTESMRLHPATRGNYSILNRDVVIEGYRVPAGTAVVCVLQHIQRNERFFKNANMFLPERWNSKEVSKMNEFAYLPFGYGKRSCNGKNLAEMEIITLTAEMLRKYAVEYHYEDVGLFTRLINVPDKPLKLKFIERKQSPRSS